MGFEGSDPQATGRPAYHPSVLLKIDVYGYLNRIQSSVSGQPSDAADRFAAGFRPRLHGG